MTRQPKFFMHLSSTNLTPDSPVSYEIRASTHHWNGKLLEDSWAVAKLEHQNIYETENALAYYKQAFLALQKTTEPSKDIRITFPEGTRSIILLDEDKEYYDAVKLVTSKGWRWEEGYSENLVTGERKVLGGTRPFHLSLSTWAWGGKNLGGSVAFSHFQKEGESKAGLLLRILETSEKAKKDFPDSIPCTNIYGQVVKDEFKTRIVFGK